MTIYCVAPHGVTLMQVETTIISTICRKIHKQEHDCREFKANAVYTYRGSNDVKLITVFGTPRRFQVPLVSPLNTPHRNDYGFLSNYWSTHPYDGENYEIPKIQGAQGKIYLRYIEKDKDGKIINNSTYAFNHVEGAYHIEKLILLGKRPTKKHRGDAVAANEIHADRFKEACPFATQQLARGSVPVGIQKDYRDRLMLPLPHFFKEIFFITKKMF